VNVGDLPRLVERLAREGTVKPTVKELDLDAMGYHKLLGSGRADRAWS